MTDVSQHKQQLRDYFDGDGFQRWSAIYGEAEVSRVRRTIRVGHNRMLARAEPGCSNGSAPPGATRIP